MSWGKSKEQVVVRTDEDGVSWRIVTHPQRPSKAIKLNDPSFIQGRVRVPRKLRVLNGLVLLPVVGIGVYLIAELVTYI